MNPDLPISLNFFREKPERLPKRLEPKRVIFQNDHTIVIWSDDTRTIVRCHSEVFDQEKGLAMAICKKFIQRNQFKKLIETAQIQDK